MKKIYVTMFVDLDDLYYGNGEISIDDSTAICAPACALSQALCNLTEREYFTRGNIAIIEDLGYQIGIKEFAPGDYHGMPWF